MITPRLTAKIFAVLACAALSLSLFGTWHFMLDNLSSFKVHFSLLFLTLVVVFGLSREWRWAALSGCALTLSLAAIVPWFSRQESSERSDESPHITVLSANVSPRLENPEKLIALLSDVRPDVVGLIELTPRVLAGLNSITSQYPYRFEAARDGFLGLALYSKLPISGAKIVRFGDDVPPAIVTNLRLGEVDVELILVHPVPPMSARLAALRNLQLDTMAAHVGNSNSPTILMGDLNTALWSTYYHGFIERSRLTNVRQGEGVASTWPANRLVGVPIDHIFYSRGLLGQSFRVLPAFGSDHLAVAANIRLVEPKNEAQISGIRIEAGKRRVDAAGGRTDPLIATVSHE